MMKMTEKEKAELKHRYAEGIANNAVEGITFTNEDNALFDYMIEQGMDEKQRRETINKYLAGQFTVPGSQAAE